MKVCSFCHRCHGDDAIECIEEGSPLASETRPGDPEMIAGYRLETLLESAAKSDTYSARQIECGRSCRIKIVTSDDGEEFLREANLAAGIFHANVADVYEAGTLPSGEVFVVGEDAGCQTLRDRLDSGPSIDLLTTILIIRQAAEALHELHLKGLIHRAVRPENIVLAEDGLQVKVRNPDFGGLAQRFIISNKFFIDSALDSLKYFAPEQCSGEEPSAQSDVYALGVVFYEMLAGTPPFDAPNAAGLIAKHKTQPPPDVRIDNFDLRMLVTHTLMESLRKQPPLRQSSANAFARQLRHIEQLANHIAKPPPVVAMPPAPSRSKPRISVAIDALTSATVAPIVTKRNPANLEAERLLEHAVEIAEVAPAMAREVASEAMAAMPVAEPDPPSATEHQFLVEVPPEIPETLREKPIVEDKCETSEIATPRRSRMKVQRKRTHSKLAAMAFELSERVSLPTNDEAATVVAVSEETPAVQMIAEPVIASSADTIPPGREPKHIEWIQPEDDIPSVEDVLETLRRDDTAATPLFRAAVQETAAPIEAVEHEAPFEEPHRIAVAPPDTWEIFEKIEPVAVPTKITSHERQPEAILAAPGIEVDDQEEITLARAVGTSRIRIDLGEPKRWKKFSAAAPQPSFAPTLLGDRKHVAVDAEVRDSMFSDFYGKSRRRIVTARRVTAMGGFVALIAVFLFGDDIVTKYQQARGSDDSAASRPALSAEPAPPPVRRSKPEPTSRKKQRQSFVEPTTVKADPPEPRASAPTSAKPKAEPKPKAAVTKTPPKRDAPAGATRPRIVPQ